MKVVSERTERVRVSRLRPDMDWYGPYEKVRVKVTSDGRAWRECLGPELDPGKLDPARLVWLGKEDAEPKPAREWEDWKVAGGHPLLHALCMLGLPVYLEEVPS